MSNWQGYKEIIYYIVNAFATLWTFVVKTKISQRDNKG